jgi:hypothetical protein
MSEPKISDEPTQNSIRPFPWFCPKCRRKEVRRVTIPYQCERHHDGKLVTVIVPTLSVPRCGHCGELVFDYDAEEQIRQVYENQQKDLGDPSGHLLQSPENAPIDRVGS